MSKITLNIEFLRCLLSIKKIQIDMKVIKMIIVFTMFTQAVNSQSISQNKLEKLSQQAEICNTEGLLIWHDGKIILEEYFGIGHPDTLIETMSCTKSIVGLAAACLLDDGFLDSLNTPVYIYYPEWNQGQKKEIENIVGCLIAFACRIAAPRRGGGAGLQGAEDGRHSLRPAALRTGAQCGD